jgi:hypothetical protein
VSAAQGYGRGYFGENQLQTKIKKKRRWWPFFLLVGVGAAAVYVLWPRRQLDYSQPIPNTYPPPSQLPPPDLNQYAQARGVPSLRSYEDAVVGQAQELRAAGARVDLGPHLQYLEARLLPAGPTGQK